MNSTDANARAGRGDFEGLVQLATILYYGHIASQDIGTAKKALIEARKKNARDERVIRLSNLMGIK